MDISANGDGPVTVAAANEGIRQQERRSVRRRLVQSTLLPHKSPEIGANSEQSVRKECKGENGDCEDDEYSGSQSKKKRTRKETRTPQTRTPQKYMLLLHKSPDIKSKDFRKRIKECNEEDGDGKCEEYCGNQKNRTQKGKTTPQRISPKKLKGKSVVRDTPTKNDSSNGKGVANMVENQDASPPIPNLRLEEKMTAEENSRMFAGKQIHPFFSSWKMSNRCNETTEAERNCCSAQKKDRSISIGPIHVFERGQEDVRSLDWGGWKFCENPFTNSNCSMEGSFSSNFGSIGSLNINPSASHPLDIPLQDNAYKDQCLCQQEFVCEAPVVASMSSDGQVACCQLVKDSETDCEVNGVGFSSGSRKSDAMQQNDLPQKSNQLEDRLWTDKYQPKKAIEVCGNDESVKFLREWLHTWQQRGYQASIYTSDADECNREDTDYYCFQSDSDSENTDEGASIKNVLLITGPIGSGKSAAIYACAKEEGFKVLEVNASECRNGAVVKQRFGEALESHSLEWSQEICVELQSKNSTKFSTAHPDGKAIQDFYKKVIEESNEYNSHGTTEASTKIVSKDTAITCGRGQLKQLILFEDVDITFSEDRGFVAAIHQIAEKAKGPVILTSNSVNPFLPANLDRLEVCFMMPSEKELLQHVYMVCSTENVNIQSHLLEQIVGNFQGDIRKTMMHLQFWFQGKQNRKIPPSREAQGLFSPQMFDPEAGHRILPKIMPWDFPSQLSELVETEIKNSLSMMEETPVSMGVIEEDFEDKEMQNDKKIPNYGNDSIEAKKEAMLSHNCSDHNCNDFKVPFDAECGVFYSPGTPVSFSRRKSRRKLDLVVSSDSEDELISGKYPLTSDMESILEADGGVPSHCPGMQNCTNPSTEMGLRSGAEKLEENCSHSPESVIDLHAKDTCTSVDVSCVPESTFVPETEINDGRQLLFSLVSCSQVADTLEEVSLSNELKQNIRPAGTGNLNKFVRKLHQNPGTLGNTFDEVAESSHEETEVSQNEHVEAITRVYQVMDECSRMDFNRRFNPVEDSKDCRITDIVRESWIKLRDRRTDLRHIVASEIKDATGIMQLAYCASDLISKADLLLLNCQTLDSLELSTVLYGVSDAFSWCDEHLQMISSIAQQGFCFYAKEIANLRSKVDSDYKLDFSWELLSTPGILGSGSPDRQNASSHKSSHSGMSQLETGTSSNSEMKSCLSDILQSIVPSRSFMTIKGDGYWEYLSSLGHIARSETSRLSASIGTTKRQRRARASRNYLSNGSLMLLPEEILLLGQSNKYGRISPQKMNTPDKNPITLLPSN